MRIYINVPENETIVVTLIYQLSHIKQRRLLSKNIDNRPQGSVTCRMKNKFRKVNVISSEGLGNKSFANISRQFNILCIFKTN